MDDRHYREHCLAALGDFTRALAERAEPLPPDDPLKELASAFAAIATDSDELYDSTPSLVARLFTTYPELAPLFPRDVLWFLGGSCLHYMADEEIDLYQAIEEERLAAADRGEVLSLADARAKRLKLQ
jgi:hypothetical protein